MFRQSIVVGLLLALAGLSGLGAARPAVAQAEIPPLAESTFDSDAEGWMAFYDVEGTLRRPTFVSTGGNPGGHITFTDQMENAQWYWRAPSKFYGNVSSAYGKVLSFALNQSDITAQFPISYPDVILRGNGITLTFNTISNPDLTWTTYRLVLEQSSGWRNAATAQPATEAEIRSVLSNLSEMSIRGEFHQGVDTGGLDNVILGGPAPTSLIYLPLVAKQ